MTALATTATDGLNYGMELPTKLSRLMEDRRVSQADVARAAGMQQTAISRVLNGKQRLYLDQARRIATFLCVGVDYLADDTLDEPRPANPESALSDDERAILRLARLLGPDEALRRLAGPRWDEPSPTPNPGPGHENVTAPSTPPVRGVRYRLAETRRRLGAAQDDALEQDEIQGGKRDR